ncbi:MAG: hypothetical protein J2O48_05965 [Solirubrobacterales bacterium]|nr:hypothetical protein [Solirubrobacterales bacterium]
MSFDAQAAPASSPLDLRDYWSVLRRNLWLIALTTVVAAVVGGLLGGGQKKSYSATATANFTAPPSASASGAAASFETQQTYAAAGAALLSSDQTLAAVKKDVHSKLSISQLRGKLSSTMNPQTYLVTITASDSSAKGAAALANAAVNETLNVSNQQARNQDARQAANYQNQLNGLKGSNKNQQTVSNLENQLSIAKNLAATATTGHVETPAQVPSSSSSGGPVQTAILGGVLGLIIGLIITGLREALDRRLGSSSDVAKELGIPTVGHIPEDTLGQQTLTQHGAAVVDDSKFEGFRILRANLEFLDPKSPPKSVVVTSALPEEGKTTVALSLALASAAAGRRTLLVECDLRRSALAKRLGTERGPGLVDFLDGRASPGQILRTLPIVVSGQASNNGAGADSTTPSDWVTAASHGDTGSGRPVLPSYDIPGLSGAEGTTTVSKPATSGQRRRRADVDGQVQIGNLTYIVGGSTSMRTAELLSSQGFQQFLEQVSDAYDLVVIDSCPLLPVADTLGIVPHADAVLMCLRASRTTRDQAHAAKAALDRFPQRPVGAVVTGVRDPSRETSYSYSYAYTRQS